MADLDSHIAKLISNYTNRSITESEFYDLKDWVHKTPENKEIFINYLKIHKKGKQIEAIEILDHDSAWLSIISKLETPFEDIKKEPQVKKLNSYTWLFKYAAIILLILSVSYYFQKNSFFSNSNNQIDSEIITLTLANGDIQYIDENGTAKIADAKGNIIGSQNGTQLSYSNAKEEKSLAYNTITVPYGKRFELILSDGTKVHLNAGTSLRYPTKFIKGKNREVFLTGEAFFNVSKDTKHPFIVNAENLDVKVLGTAFNVSAYKEDTTTNVVLVEGSVEMFNESINTEEKTLLKPGDKGAFNKHTSTITTKQVNTLAYTSWMEGALFFRNMPFENIVKKLERHYNVTIVINNNNLNQETFNASFKNEPIENILNYFSKSFDINYEIKNNIIYIN